MVCVQIPSERVKTVYPLISKRQALWLNFLGCVTQVWAFCPRMRPHPITVFGTSLHRRRLRWLEMPDNCMPSPRPIDSFRLAFPAKRCGYGASPHRRKLRCPKPIGFVPEGEGIEDVRVLGRAATRKRAATTPSLLLKGEAANLRQLSPLSLWERVRVRASIKPAGFFARDLR